MRIVETTTHHYVMHWIRWQACLLWRLTTAGKEEYMPAKVPSSDKLGCFGMLSINITVLHRQLAMRDSILAIPMFAESFSGPLRGQTGLHRYAKQATSTTQPSPSRLHPPVFNIQSGQSLCISPDS